MRSPVDERGSSWSITSRSRNEGTTFSIPITVTSTSGSVVHIRPFPSDSTTTTLPVSAQAKLAPETATRARRKASRRKARAAAVSSPGSSPRPVEPEPLAGTGRGSPSGSCGSRARAGATGRSPASCTISSARSVSSAWIPAAASASFSPISSVVSDFTLTTSVAPSARTISVTIALASPASRAQWTTPPRLVTDSSSSSRSRSSESSAWSLIAAPASRSSSQSATSPTASARLARIVVVACRTFARIWPPARASSPPAGTARPPPRARPASRGQHLGEMDGTHVRASAAQPAADVQQAGRIARAHRVRPARDHAVELRVEHRRRHVGVLDGERATESAALLGVRQLDELHARNRPQQRDRQVAEPEEAERVAGRVVGERAPVGGADVERPACSTRNSESSRVRPGTPRSSSRSSETCFRTCAAHEPEGVTIASNPSKTSTNLAARSRASSTWPELKCIWPQHVCSTGNSTSSPTRSRTVTVARPTSGASVSARHVMKSPYAMAGKNRLRR